MMEDLVEGFLEDPAGTAAPDPIKKKISYRASRKGNDGFREKRDNDESIHKAERDRIRAKHEEKEKDLIDGLQAQMAQKKQMLEERLRKKKAAAQQEAKQGGESKDSGGISPAAHDDEEAMARDDIARLEQVPYVNQVNPPQPSLQKHSGTASS